MSRSDYSRSVSPAGPISPAHLWMAWLCREGRWDHWSDKRPLTFQRERGLSRKTTNPRTLGGNSRFKSWLQNTAANSPHRSFTLTWYDFKKGRAGVGTFLSEELFEASRHLPTCPLQASGLEGGVFLSCTFPVGKVELNVTFAISSVLKNWLLDAVTFYLNGTTILL